MFHQLMDLVTYLRLAVQPITNLLSVESEHYPLARLTLFNQIRLQDLHQTKWQHLSQIKWLNYLLQL